MSEAVDIDLLPKPNISRLVISDELPEQDLITAVGVYAFSEDGILMARLHNRGWDLPAGHIDAGETPEQAVRRECLEETAVHLDEVAPLGFCELVVKAPEPEDYRYPYPTSYIVSFFGTIGQVEQFEPNEEALERGFLDEQSASMTQVIQGTRELYEEAVRRSLA